MAARAEGLCSLLLDGRPGWHALTHQWHVLLAGAATVGARTALRSRARRTAAHAAVQLIANGVSKEERARMTW